MDVIVMSKSGIFYRIDHSRIEEFRNIDQLIETLPHRKLTDKHWKRFAKFDGNVIAGDISNYTFDNFRKRI